MANNQTELLQWLADLFEEPLVNVRPETPREEIPGWDSLGVLVLMANLDERFGILLSESEIADLQSIGEVLTLINERGSE